MFIVPLLSSDYLATIKRMNDLGITGGAVYDALIVRAAQKSGASRIVTFNVNDYKRIWPEEPERITAPWSDDM